MQNNLLCRQAIWLATGRSDPIQTSHLGLPGSSLIARDVIWGDSEFVLQGGCKAYVWLANGLYPWVWQWAPPSPPAPRPRGRPGADFRRRAKARSARQHVLRRFGGIPWNRWWAPVLAAGA